MGMPYPGGIALDKVAEDGDPFAFKLPRPTVSGSQYDFSFSGLKTAVINLIHNSAQKGIELNKADVCASFRYAVVDCLKTNFLKAAEDLKVDKRLLRAVCLQTDFCVLLYRKNVISTDLLFICPKNLFAVTMRQWLARRDIMNF